MTDHPVTVRLTPVVSWALPIGGALILFSLGFAVRPLFEWITAQFDTAPGPLRIAAMLPTGWVVLILAVVGAVGGGWLAAQWRADSLVVTAGDTGVRLAQNGRTRLVPGVELSSAMRDGADLVLLTVSGRELSRNKSDDLSAAALRRALESIGCRWIDGNPFDTDFESWVDGHPGLPEALNELLRRRSAALTDGQAGAVYAVTEQLRSAGVAVRDRSGVQQYRVVRSG